MNLLEILLENQSADPETALWAQLNSDGKLLIDSAAQLRQHAVEPIASDNYTFIQTLDHITRFIDEWVGQMEDIKPQGIKEFVWYWNDEAQRRLTRVEIIGREYDRLIGIGALMTTIPSLIHRNFGYSYDQIKAAYTEYYA